MNPETATRSTDNAFCLSCGYSLRELPAARCPECGRPFDPADPRTMSLGQPLRPWQRWLLRPTGWRVIALVVLGTAALAYLSRWPRLSPEPPSVLLDEFHWPRPGTMPPTAPDVVFYAAVVLWAVFIAWTVFWQLARLLLVPRAGRRAKVWEIDTRRRHRVIIDAAFLSIICMIFGWQSRVGRRWMARAMAPVPAHTRFGGPYDPRYDPWRQSPVALTPQQVQAALSTFLIDPPSPNERLHALGLLVDAAGRAALPVIVQASRTEKDPNTLVWELRLIGLCRDPATVPILFDGLHDPRADVRAAAADAISILRHPSYSVYVPDGFWVCDPLSLDTRPPIYVGGIVSSPSRDGMFFNGGFAEHELQNDPPIAVDPSVRTTLERMMLTGGTTAEREAAARALVDWPPEHFHLRIAEWGVWVSNRNHMALTGSLLDEIPTFVHKTGNLTDDFRSYFLYPSGVHKPVVHLTSDVPLAVDIEAQISEGRPWFAYPRPDDFGIGVESESRQSRAFEGPGLQPAGFPSTQPAPDDFSAPPLPALADCREGYPWLLPHHRLYRTESLGDAGIFRLGLRWQSLVVSPNRLPWMSPPAMPSNPGFHWWERLREVPSSWVASRGESERFLYYDGPTRAPVPVTARLEDSGRRIVFAFAPRDTWAQYGSYYRDAPRNLIHPIIPERRTDLPEHEGLYIDVHSGQVLARTMEIAGGGSVPLNLDPALTGEAAVAGRLRGMLVRYGLTGPEADGLIAAWAPQFFRAEGRRFLLRMSPAEYARQCPMQVRPTPTEVVRLGLVLTEFDPAPATSAHGTEP